MMLTPSKNALAYNIDSPAVGTELVTRPSDYESQTAAVKRQASYKVIMPLLRQQMREKLLGNLWLETQKNPDFRIGALSLSELFKRLESFDLFENATDQSLQVDPERTSDFYVLNKNWGVLNQITKSQSTLQGLTLLPLHIFLGAAGYQDENYRLSLALLLYDQSLQDSSSEMRTLELEKLFPQTIQELYRPTIIAGGFTGVGGGGDIVSMLAKAEMMKYMFAVTSRLPLYEKCRSRWSQPLAFVNDVLAIKIESSQAAKDVTQETRADGTKWILLPSIDTKNALLLSIVTKSAILNLCQIVASRP